MQALGPKRSIRRARPKLALLFPLVDAVCIIGWAWGLCRFLYVRWSMEYGVMATAAAVLFYLVAEHVDLYHSWRGSPILVQAQAVVMAWLPALLGLLMLGYATKMSAFYARRVLLTWFVCTPPVLTLWRVLFRWALHLLRARGLNMRVVAVAGGTPMGLRVAEMIRSAPWLGMAFKGVYDDRGGERLTAEAGVPVETVGTLSELVDGARAGEVDLIYITLPLKAEERMKELVERLADTTASVHYVPDFFVFNLLHARMANFGDLPTVSIFENPFYETAGWVKRVEDLTLVVVLLLLAAIPMAVIAVAVKWTSPGPVLFVQHRYGLDGRRIPVLKFRTMTVCEDSDAVRQATRDDPRVTRLGAFLRRTSLDELPQFFNVLVGQMSLVGPRPHAVAHNEQYRKLIRGYMLRHKVKPGITGWAQVNGFRGETDVLEKMAARVRYDLDYIRNWSLWLDLKILVCTLSCIFKDPNAY